MPLPLRPAKGEAWLEPKKLTPMLPVSIRSANRIAHHLGFDHGAVQLTGVFRTDPHHLPGEFGVIGYRTRSWQPQAILDARQHDPAEPDTVDLRRCPVQEVGQRGEGPQDAEQRGQVHADQQGLSGISQKLLSSHQLRFITVNFLCDPAWDWTSYLPCHTGRSEWQRAI